MPPDSHEVAPFHVKDCALLAIATGRRAQNLKELRDQLLTADLGSLYYHFWGGLLHPRFEEREYNNDFAAWAIHALHDKVLAERLSVVDPNEFASLEALRQELIEVIETRLDEREVLSWAQPDQQFAFLRSQIVIFDAGRRIASPEDLASQLAELSVSSVFYHFIDARRRNDNRRDDFSNWLSSFGDAYEPSCHLLEEVDPYFTALSDLRAELADILASSFCRVLDE